jgi:hypothetical protein
MITSSTASTDNPALRTASPTAIAPKRGAGTEDSVPSSFPIGVRQPAIKYEALMMKFFGEDRERKVAAIQVAAKQAVAQQFTAATPWLPSSPAGGARAHQFVKIALNRHTQ